ncbi:MAG: hypothetical protein ACI39R_09400 [Lachnospiraceae bacterium]
MELNSENIDLIKKKIADTEADIDNLNEEINGMAEEKAKLTEAYTTAKEDYENYLDEYTEKSSSGLYFLIVSTITFVVITFMVLNHSIVDFFFYPALVLFIAGIILKVIGGARFKKMKPVMEEKTKVYESSKEAYEKFMEGYNATELELEKKQYQWELVENDMIQARKDAWEAAQKLAGAN